MTDDLFTEPPRVEPSAELRQMALMVRSTYIAYREAGFTEEQAMDLIKTQIASASGGGSGDK